MDYISQINSAEKIVYMTIVVLQVHFDQVEIIHWMKESVP